MKHHKGILLKGVIVEVGVGNTDISYQFVKENNHVASYRFPWRRFLPARLKLRGSG